MRIKEKGQGLVEYELILFLIAALIALYEIAGPFIKAIIATILCSLGIVEYCF